MPYLSGKQWRAALGWGVLTAAVLFCAPAWSQSAKSHFSAGVAASQQGDHQSALQHFLDARRSGLHSSALYYNLGVTYYRLGRLESAAAIFEKLTASDQTAALAWYNLGLIAYARGDTRAAIERFLRAESAAGTAKMRELARNARAGVLDPPKAGPRLSAWIELGAGYDDNVLLLPETFSNASDREDAAARLTGFARLLLAGDRDNGWLIEGVTHQERYRDTGDTDFGTTLVDLEYHHSAGRWRYALAGGYRHATVGGETFDNGRQLSIEVTARLASMRLHTTLETEDIDTAPAYYYLDGERRSAALRLNGTGKHNWRLSYRYEAHDRTDLLLEDGDFFSYSPARNTFGATYRKTVSASLSLEAGVQHRRSRYRDPDRRGELSAHREDTQNTLSAGAFYSFGDAWRAGIELTGTRNESNFNEYDYRRNTVMFTVDRGFEFSR